MKSFSNAYTKRIKPSRGGRGKQPLFACLMIPIEEWRADGDDGQEKCPESHESHKLFVMPPCQVLSFMSCH